MGGIAGPDGTRETILRVVGDLDGLILGVDGDDHEDRAEDLLAGDRHVPGDLGEDRGLDVVARLEALGGLGSTDEKLGALIDAGLDVTADPVALDGGDERADHDALGLGVAWGEAPGGGHGDGLDLVELGPRDDHAGQRRARLA